MMTRMKELPDHIKIWKYEATKYATGIMCIVSVVALVVFVIALILPCLCKTSLIFWATFIGSCIAIANAILLYATLNSQKESLANEKKAHKQERFETTFFNLLQVQRKITDELSAKYEFIGFNGTPKSQEVTGRAFFTFVNNEMQLITKSLNSEVIAKYDLENIELTISAFEAAWDNKDPTHVQVQDKQQEWVKKRANIQIQYTNFVYDITTKDKEDYSTTSNFVYNIFIRKWYPAFEHYIRNLYYILQYVYEENYSNKKDLGKYVNFIQSQMSRNELYVIVSHGKSFKHFQELLNKTHLTDIITSNKL